MKEGHDEAKHERHERANAKDWKDNDLDCVKAVINRSVEIVNPEDALDGGKACIFVCEGGCVLFKNHLFEDYRKNWSGITGVTTKGEETSHMVCTDPQHEGLQIHELGPVSGKQGYVACRYVFKDGKPSEFRIYELDGKFEKTREIQANLAMNELFEYVMEDAKGYVHVAFWRENDCHSYMVVSPEGEKVLESDLGKGPGEIRLCAFGGGRVAVCDTTYDGNEINRDFFEADLETGLLNRIAVLGDETVRGKMGEGLFAATLVNDDEIAWCDLTGVWLYVMENKDARLLYEWSKHEIDLHEIYDFTINGDGTIGLAYADHYGSAISLAMLIMSSLLFLTLPERMKTS